MDKTRYGEWVHDSIYDGDRSTNPPPSTSKWDHSKDFISSAGLWDLLFVAALALAVYLVVYWAQRTDWEWLKQDFEQESQDWRRMEQDWYDIALPYSRPRPRHAHTSCKFDNIVITPILSTARGNLPSGAIEFTQEGDKKVNFSVRFRPPDNGVAFFDVINNGRTITYQTEYGPLPGFYPVTGPTPPPPPCSGQGPPPSPSGSITPRPSPDWNSNGPSPGTSSSSSSLALPGLWNQRHDPSAYHNIGRNNSDNFLQNQRRGHESVRNLFSSQPPPPLARDPREMQVFHSEAHLQKNRNQNRNPSRGLGLGGGGREPNSGSLFNSAPNKIHQLPSRFDNEFLQAPRYHAVKPASNSRKYYGSDW